LESIFKNKSFIGNYPRNYVFYDQDAGVRVKNNLGYDGKRLYAYMPTWRDADTPKQKAEHFAPLFAFQDNFMKKL
jgi:hypothetical protein